MPAVTTSQAEQDAMETALRGALDSGSHPEGALTAMWMAARHWHSADPSGIGIDVVLQGLERIIEVAEEANKPLHRNEMRVDWAQALGAGERRYVEGLRGTLTECARLAQEMIKLGQNSCLCKREPGTNPDCPVHQLATEDDA